MTTARLGLPNPCSPHAKTRDESSGGGEQCDGIASLVEYVGATYYWHIECLQYANFNLKLCESSKC